MDGDLEKIQKGCGGMNTKEISGKWQCRAADINMWLWREKFYFNESYKYTHFDDISGIITDEFPDDTIVNILRNTGVKLL